jgi:predicted transcriptional regulator/rubredoxin
MSNKNSSKTITFKQAKAALDAPRPARRSEQHGIMPNAFREVFYRKGLSVSARLVAIWLYDHLKPGGNEATGGQDLIAEDLGITTKTVRSAVKELYRYGVIISIDRQQNSRGGFFNIYKMRIYEQKQRDTGKILKLVNPLSAQATQKPKKSKPVVGKMSLNVCQICNGTGWEFIPATRASHPCPACRKPPSTDKKP